MSAAVARLQALATPYRRGRQRAVYIVQYGELFKIGLSVNPIKRIKAFMLPEVVSTMRVYWVPKAEEFELALHRRYVMHRAYGEWFRLPESAFGEMDALAEEWKQAKLCK